MHPCRVSYQPGNKRRVGLPVSRFKVWFINRQSIAGSCRASFIRDSVWYGCKNGRNHHKYLTLENRRKHTQALCSRHLRVGCHSSHPDLCRFGGFAGCALWCYFAISLRYKACYCQSRGFTFEEYSLLECAVISDSYTDTYFRSSVERYRKQYQEEKRLVQAHAFADFYDVCDAFRFYTEGRWR